MNTKQDPAGSRLDHTTDSPTVTVRVKHEVYGKGYPGYSVAVSLWIGKDRIALAFGPNVNGWHLGQFVGRAEIDKAILAGDGAQMPLDAALALLCRWHADAISSRLIHNANMNQNQPSPANLNEASAE